MASRLLPLLLLAVGVSWVYLPRISSGAIPGGDGRRIYGLAETAAGSEAFYPLWNPYELAGFPTLADAERWIWLGKLLPTSNPESFNLCFNLLLLIALSGYAAASYVLARRFSISPAGAAVCAFILVSTEYTVTTWTNARLLVLVSRVLFLACLILYKDVLSGGSKWKVLGVAAASGLVFQLTGYYALFQYFPPMIFVGWHFRRESGDSGPFRRAIADNLKLGVAGGLLGAVFLLPLVFYNLGSYSSQQPFRLLGETLPSWSSAIRLFLPVDVSSGRFTRQEVFPFVSLALFPLLVSLIPRKARRGASGHRVFLLLGGLSLPFLLGSVFPFSGLVTLLEHTPILWHVRHALTFHFLLCFSLAFLCGFGFDSLGLRPERRWIESGAGIAFLALAAPLLLSESYGSSHESGPWLAVAALLAALPWSLLASPRSRKLYVTALIGYQLLFFKIDSDIEPTTNEITTPNINAALHQDADYYRIASRWNRRLAGIPSELSLNGFSLHLSRELELQLERLFQKELDASRPYGAWAEQTRFEEWNQDVLAALNVKYFISPRPLGKEQPKWEEVAEDPPLRLWRKRNWASSLRLFDRWEVEPNWERAKTRLREPQFLEFRALLEGHSPVGADG